VLRAARPVAVAAVVAVIFMVAQDGAWGASPLGKFSERHQRCPLSHDKVRVGRSGVAGGGVVEGGDDGMRGMVTRFGGLLVVIGLMAGCSVAAKEPVGPTASPTAVTASPTATPTPTATTGVVREVSDPALGIVFEKVPDVHGDPADVYNWMAVFEKEYWRMMTTNQVSPAFSIMASAEIQARMQQIATGNANDQAKVGGVFHATIADITVDGDTAHATKCDDYRSVTFADVKGTYTPDQAGFGENRLLEATLVRGPAAGQWIIQSEEKLGTC